jgi:hypothetical protein
MRRKIITLKKKIMLELLSSGCDSIKLIKSEYTFNSSVRMMLYSDDLALLLAQSVKISIPSRAQANLFSDRTIKIPIVDLLSYLDKTPSNLCTSSDLTLLPP